MFFSRRFASQYAPRRLPPTIKELLGSNIPQETSVSLNGWIKSIRKQKRVSFAVISDGSNAKGIQAVFPNTLDVKDLTNGSSVRLTGNLVSSPGSGQAKELQVKAVDVLGACPQETYPIQKKDLTNEYLRENVHLRARTTAIAAMLRLRDCLHRSIHDYLKSQSFVHVHAPILTANDAEGAGETFRIAPVAAHPDAQVTETQSPTEFFGAPAHLTVSSQLHMEAFQAALSRVYTANPAFRAERSQTSRHLAEFWMVEPEWTLTEGITEVCDVTEDLLRDIVNRAFVECADDVDALHAVGGRLERLEALKAAVSPDTPRWWRMTYTEAVGTLQRTGVKFKQPPTWGASLSSEHERYLAEEVVKGPVFVTNYPREIKAFYMRVDDPSLPREQQTVSCFDLLVPHMGELVGGSVREERADVLEEKMREEGMILPEQSSKADEGPYAWYLSLRKFGATPHGGFGLGFERLVSWVGDVDSVKECIPVPRTVGRIDL
ncbi:asparaginyl-tRNA synthetase [Schizophyllum commune Loenen D]|nr:asparaginyl-tRNA synthetase [Schizophyllum commune Loenen D]